MPQKPTETAKEVLGLVDLGLGLVDRILAWTGSPIARAARLRREASLIYKEAQELPKDSGPQKRKIAKARRKWRRAERLDPTGAELETVALRTEAPREPSPT